MTLWHQLDADARDAMVVHLVATIGVSGMPHHLHGGLVRYFSDGILPGGFLQAVLCNDLREAVLRAAPDITAASLFAIIVYLNTFAPAQAWGSRAAVLAWTTPPDRLEIPA